MSDKTKAPRAPAYPKKSPVTSHKNSKHKKGSHSNVHSKTAAGESFLSKLFSLFKK